MEVYGASALGVENNQINKTKIFPNPVKDLFIVTESAGATMEIYNIQGKLLLKKPIENNKQEVNISNFTSGMYFVKVKKDGTVFNKKIIKE